MRRYQVAKYVIFDSEKYLSKSLASKETFRPKTHSHAPTKNNHFAHLIQK
jgi:hypothetical protein